MKILNTNPLNTKNNKLKSLLISVVILAIFFLCKVSIVKAEDVQLNVHDLVKTGEILPLEKIRQSAKALITGDILETELERKHGIYIYEVEILDDKSQVWELKLNAKTGKLIKMEHDD